jgi:hypothetical protein
MKEKQSREVKLPSKLLTSKQIPRPRLGRCPHLQNLTAKLRKTQTSGKNSDLAHVLPIPKAHRREEVVPLPLLHHEFKQSSKEEKKCTIKLENERGVEE